MSIRLVNILLLLLLLATISLLTLLAWQGDRKSSEAFMYLGEQETVLRDSTLSLSSQLDELEGLLQKGEGSSTRSQELLSLARNNLERVARVNVEDRSTAFMQGLNIRQNLYLMLGLVGLLAVAFYGMIVLRLLSTPLRNMQTNLELLLKRDFSHVIKLPQWREFQAVEGVYDELIEQLEAEHKERQKAEMELGQALYDKSALLSSMGDAVFGVDPEGKVTFANPASEQLMGWAQREIMGKAYHATMRQTMKNGQPFRLMECPIYKTLKDGQIRRIAEDVFSRKVLGPVPVEYTVSPVRESDRIIGAVVVFKDILERKKMDEELRQHRDHLQQMVDDQTRGISAAKDEAVRANEAKTEFLANMSHELRTPMHAILSFSEIGEGKVKLGKVSAESMLRYFARINESGQRLMTLLNSLLDLSKLESGKYNLDQQTHDLRDVVDTVVEEYSELARKRSIMVGVGHTSISTEASFDEMKLIQVMRNLVSNAIKFSPDGGSIRIAFSEPENPPGVKMQALSVSVSDHGLGIPDNELEAVFDKFVQSSKTKTGAGGTGLGLAISKEIIEAHQGVIRARNNTNGGAVITFTIPRHAENAVAESVPLQRMAG